MLKIFLGNDRFGKEQAFLELAHKSQLQIRRITEHDPVPDIAQLSSTALFGPVEFFVFDNCIEKTDLLEKIDQLLNANCNIVILEDTKPKRGSKILELINNSNIEVVEFNTLALDKLPAWLSDQAEIYGTSITPQAIQSLIAALVPEPASFWDKPEPDLTMFYNEIKKLASYADGKPITEQAVDLLTQKNDSAEVWHVVNAMADKNSKALFAALHKFFNESDSPNSDTGKYILLNALLADQFRNLLLVKEMDSQQIADKNILAKTGWKSGRLNQLRKTSSRFESLKLKQILQRLENLDIELKTTNTPPRPILDLILAQVL